jgi:hypothetical protein
MESLGTTYAEEDIASAKELTEKVVKERVGQRIRELVAAVEGNLKEYD